MSDGKASDDNADLVVIGAGSAGFSASITAAELGARVTLIGHGAIGGTCMNVGCVPSKTLIRATEALHHAERASRFAGIHGNGTLNDWRAVQAQKDALVGELRQAKYTDLLPAYNNVAYLEGQARIADGGVAINGDLIKTGKVIVATGASPALSEISGVEDVPYLTSTTALELDRLPASLLVVGAGYIGCELAQMFARAGVDVTIVCRRRLLPETEPEISDALTGYFRDEGITVHDGIASADNLLFRQVSKAVPAGVRPSEKVKLDAPSLVLQHERALGERLLGRFRCLQVQCRYILSLLGRFLPTFGFITPHLLGDANVRQCSGALPGPNGIAIGMVAVVVGIENVLDGLGR